MVVEVNDKDRHEPLRTQPPSNLLYSVQRVPAGKARGRAQKDHEILEGLCDQDVDL